MDFNIESGIPIAAKTNGERGMYDDVARARRRGRRAAGKIARARQLHSVFAGDAWQAKAKLKAR